MLCLAAAGLNWSLKGQRVTMFGLSGRPLPNGDWELPLFKHPTAWSEVPPLSISAVLKDLIRQDIEKGKGDNIATFDIYTVAGLRLALEGVLTKRILTAADESADNITVTLPITGKNRKVIIWSPDKVLNDGIDTYTAAGQAV